MSELNLRLQGENQHLPDLYTNIKTFRQKIILFQSQLRKKCFTHFKTFKIFSHTTETLAPEVQMEVIDVQCNDMFKNKYKNSSLLEFYKSLPLVQFDNLHYFARGLFAVVV
ncbi:hypothetical protein HHI36_023204 [Cryptolaemus montrouzieri]|uniref:Uncharacterized protein n=1 Tax=Cryptolaemus montrouzieri TaxID=559131 RepID=A0ABD2PFN4_9CUCU